MSEDRKKYADIIVFAVRWAYSGVILSQTFWNLDSLVHHLVHILWSNKQTSSHPCYWFSTLSPGYKILGFWILKPLTKRTHCASSCLHWLQQNEVKFDSHARSFSEISHAKKRGILIFRTHRALQKTNDFVQRLKNRINHRDVRENNWQLNQELKYRRWIQQRQEFKHHGQTKTTF